MRKKKQIFRFCCGCSRVSLIQKGKCYFCDSKFILKTKTDDLYIRPKKYAETH